MSPPAIGRGHRGGASPATQPHWNSYAVPHDVDTLSRAELVALPRAQGAGLTDADADEIAATLVDALTFYGPTERAAVPGEADAFLTGLATEQPL